LSSAAVLSIPSRPPAAKWIGNNPSGEKKEAIWRKKEYIYILDEEDY
jgi:hypothetical protein